MKKIIVGIGEGKIAIQQDILVSYALGSCIGVCLYDEARQVAGMAHIVLPRHPSGELREKYKYADIGVVTLLEEMIHAGARRRYIVAKVVGGAEMFPSVNQQWQIGKQSIQMVFDILKQERIRVIAKDVGKNYGRTVTFYAFDGRVEVHSLRNDKVI